MKECNLAACAAGPAIDQAARSKQGRLVVASIALLKLILVLHFPSAMATLPRLGAPSLGMRLMSIFGLASQLPCPFHLQGTGAPTKVTPALHAATSRFKIAHAWVPNTMTSPPSMQTWSSIMVEPKCQHRPAPRLWISRDMTSLPDTHSWVNRGWIDNAMALLPDTHTR
eukprot:scaffold86650_cov17-Tisochrysis_lutea.AAC.1